MPLAAAFLAVGITALGAALDVNEGHYAPAGLLYLTVAALAALGALGAAATPAGAAAAAAAARVPRWVGPAVLGACLAWQCGRLLTSYPGTLWSTREGDARRKLAELRNKLRYYLEPGERRSIAMRAEAIEVAIARGGAFKAGAAVLGVSAAAALALGARAGTRRWGAGAFGAAVAAFVFLGAGMIRANPSPHVDVFAFQQGSCRALLEGRNPYAEHLPNIYGADATVYGEGLFTAERVLFGYPYPPLTLYLALPAYAAGGDHRYAQLAALALAAALIAAARPWRESILAPAGALLLLTSPRLLMMIELGWTEPFVILFLSLTVFCAARAPKLMPVALGLLLASKQYLVFVAPLALLLAPDVRSYLRTMAVAAGVALVVSLPLVLWDARAFVHSAVTLQVGQPFRPDALAYPAGLWWAGRHALATALPLAAWPAALAAVGLSIWRLPRAPWAFALATALTYLAFYAANKQAFCNYYFFPLAATCCALATLPGGVDRPEQGSQGGRRGGLHPAR